MPELPEVETVRRGLEKEILGKKIASIKVEDYAQNIAGPLDEQLGASVSSVGRRAKYLLLHLDNSNSLIVHLKMTGQFIPGHIAEKNKKLSFATKVLFSFTDGSTLHFNDWRKFGEINVLPSDAIEQFFHEKALGPEALDEKFSFQEFSEILHRKRRSRLKTTLMDQKVISGLGNIYAQEACFLSRIDPRRKIESLTLEEGKNLYDAIRAVLSQAITFNGTSFDTAYVTVNGQGGNFSQFLHVYKQKKCKVCQEEISLVSMSSRSTYFCASCQR